MMTAADRNMMYDALAAVYKLYPGADLQIVAVGLGAEKAVMLDDVLLITLEDGSGFAFLFESLEN